MLNTTRMCIDLIIMKALTIILIAALVLADNITESEEPEISSEESKEDIKEATKYKSTYSKGYASFDKYINNRTLACSYITRCIYRQNSKAIQALSHDEENDNKISNYVFSDIMMRCYSKIPNTLADGIVSKPEDECKCTTPEVEAVASFNVEAYENIAPSALNMANYAEFNSMMLAVDEMNKKMEKSRAEMERNVKPMLFGQELGKQSGAFQLIYGVAIVVALVIVFAVLISKLSEKKDKKKSK